MRRKVVIIYANEDRAAAETICSALERCGIACWIAPRDVTLTERWALQTMQAIARARLVVLAFSHHSNRSPEIPQEVAQADRRGVRTLTVRLEDAQPSSTLKPLLESRHWMDAFIGSLESHLPRLCEEVEELFRREAAKRRRKIAIFAGSATLLGTSMALLVWWFFLRRYDIAVVAFNVLKTDEDIVGQRFAEGIAVNLATRQRARAIGEGLGTHDPPSMARSLGVPRLVTGTLERLPDMLRASVTYWEGSNAETINLQTAEKDVGSFASRLAEEILKLEGLGPRPKYDLIDYLPGGPKIRDSSLIFEARKAFRNTDTPAAIRLTEQLVMLDPADPEAQAMHTQARLFAFWRGQSPESRTALEESMADLMRKSPEAPYADIIRASYLQLLGCKQEANALLSRVLEKDNLTPAGRAWVLRRRSSVRADLGLPVASMEDIQAAHDNDPTNITTMIYLSKAKVEARDFEGAVEPAKSAVAFVPESAEGHRTLSVALLKVHRMEESVAEIQEACRLAQSQESCAALAVRLLQAGNRTAADKEAEAAAGLKPSNVGSYNLGVYYALSGPRSKALDWLRKADDLKYANARIKTDEDLESLHGDPQFEAIVAQVMARLVTTCKEH